ncbi:dentin sialophosphoprotein isoform X2 [Benincasa hispida]|uniref:dentin sialophosphoprotein isoform X2 n=1 Tax=Benincasa hispida TaxID=102211 RepID=UPI0019010514|nr:dentin sialophosphoprotein isoform X2 [Benincasa hispida]
MRTPRILVVIDVGGKEFRFTWSREVGDLCDIYEERKSGEDGSGLLIESGNAWRKLNVQRILDESTTNHVKKLSEEAERRSKSRRAIVLEPGNPSMKNQIKQLAAAEANPWRHFKNKKEPPFKKQKNELSQVGPPKSTYKPGISSLPASKDRLSSSPIPSPPEQSGAPVSHFGSANTTKTHVITEDIRPRLPAKVNAAASSEKEISTKAAKGVLETPGQEGNSGAKTTDLQGMLYNLLLENPKGMSLKALEKAVGDKIPNAVKKIEPIIKKIATYQAPGRYCLKSGVELEGSKKPSSEGESSPLISHHQNPPVHEDLPDQITAPELQLEARSGIELEEKVETSQANKKSNFLEKNGIQQHSPDLFAEKKGSENSERQAASSSDNESDSDSESDSSDSGSDSGNHSRSRSRSPVGSGSGSSSDSESEVPSNSKEGSDEDVDIMTSDDDKESKHKLQASAQGFSTSPAAWKSPDGGAVQIIDDEKEDGQESDAIDIENDSSDDEPDAKIDDRSFLPIEGGRLVEEPRSFSPYPDEFQERQNFIGSLFEDRDNTVVDSGRHEQSDSTGQISKGKSKRSSDLECLEEKSDHTKRLKSESLAQQPVSSKHGRDSVRNPTSQVTNKGEVKGNSDFRPKKGHKETVSEKNSSDVSQAGWRPHDQSGGVRAVDTAARTDKHGDIGRGTKHTEKSGHANENFHMFKDTFHGNAENEGTKEKKVSKNSRSGGPGDKQIQPFDSHHSKPGEIVGKFKDGQTFSSSQMGYSPRDNNNRISANRSPVNGKGRILQRELSDLELGELRDPFPEESRGKKKFERNNSLKQLENKESTTDIWGSDLSRGKSNLKTSLEYGKRSPPHVSTKFPSNPEGSNKKKTSEHIVEDSTRLNQRSLQSHPQYNSRVDHVEVDKSIAANVKPNQGIGPEGCGESNRKASVGISQLNDMKREQLPSKKGSKRLAPNPITEVTEALKNPVSAERENSDPKRRDSSSDENSCSYSKYEKDEPELKGAIKDFSQYEEYVQEYHDKYESYLSLNKILESYRAEFCKLGKELDSARGQDSEKYFNVLGQLKESYRLCSARHKRLKKIFIVLHEELKHIKDRIRDFARTSAKD